LKERDNITNYEKAIAILDKVILELNQEAAEVQEDIGQVARDPNATQERLDELDRLLKKSQGNLPERQKDRERVQQSLAEAQTYLKGLMTDWKEYRETEGMTNPKESGKKRKKSA
jgi:uncharacterized coiled-coil DUF342 family protein